MTAYRFVTLTCDSCGAVFDNGMHTTFKGTRRDAARYGWKQPVRGKDLCGDCLERGEETTND